MDGEGNFTNIKRIFLTKAHEGLEGNERADKAAKSAREKQAENPKVSYLSIL